MKQFKDKHMKDMFKRIKSPDVLEEILRLENNSSSLSTDCSKELDGLLDQKPRKILKVIKKDVDELLDVNNISTPFIYKHTPLKTFITDMSRLTLMGLPMVPSFVIGYNALSGQELLGETWQYITALGTALFINASFSMPEPNVTSSYDGNFNLIRLNTHKHNSIAVIAHEYTHHVQASKGMGRGFNIFSEGQAVCVQKIIGNTYAEKYAAHSLREGTNDGFARYMQTAKESLKDKKEIISPYILGTTLFSIYEYEFGRDIYKDVLKKDFEWPKSTYIKG